MVLFRRSWAGKKRRNLRTGVQLLGGAASMMRSIRGDLATLLKDGLDVEIAGVGNVRKSRRGTRED